MANITCFGEVLWDVFPDCKKIGGAPLNVALRLKSLENSVTVISKIGTDSDGNKIYEYLKKEGIHLNGIQKSKKLKTGAVNVVLNSKGSASYDIMFPSAWDNIQLTNATKLIASKSDAFVFGSLVARDNSSRKTLYELLDLADYKIFDVNLRPPHYTMSVITYLLKKSDFIKFNDDEIFEISNELGFLEDSLEQNILFIAKEYNVKTICVTKGSKGAVLYFNETFFYHKGYEIEVVDTVGAGDSFLASLISGILNNVSPQNALSFACAIGALVAGKQGANPIISINDVSKFMKEHI